VKRFYMLLYSKALRTILLSPLELQALSSNSV